jgi:hypothetical protein
MIMSYNWPTTGASLAQSNSCPALAWMLRLHCRPSGKPARAVRVGDLDISFD